MKKIVLFVLLLISPFIGISQEFADLFKVNYSKSGKTDFENSPETTILSVFRVNTTLPVVLNEKYTIISGVDFSNNNLQLSPNADYANLYSTRLKAGLHIKYSEHWSGTYVVLPKLASDYKNLNNDDFYIGGVILLKYNKNKNLSYKYGLYGSTEAFGLNFTPIIGLYYKSPDSRFEFNSSLPVDFDLNYSISDKAKLGFDYDTYGDSYKLYDGTSSSTYVQNNTLEFSTYYQNNSLHKSFLLRLKMGVSINSFEVYPVNEKIDLAITLLRFGDNRTQLNVDLSESLFFRIEAIYRFDINSLSSPK